MTITYCYPYKRGTGYRSQAFRSNPGPPFNPDGGHTGFDQAMDAGTPIYSPCDGIIRNSGWLTDNYLTNEWWLTAFGGDTLVIDATSSFVRAETLPTFIIAHLSESLPAVGERVVKGQLVGYSGNSGTASTGPHAHIEALPPMWDWNNGVYGRVDPEYYFTEYPGEITAQSTPIQKELEDIMATANEAALALLKMRIARRDRTGKQDGVTSVEQVIANFNQTMVRLFERIDAVDAKHTAYASTTHQKQNATIELLTAIVANPNLTADDVRQAVGKGLADTVNFIHTETTFDLKLPTDTTDEIK